MYFYVASARPVVDVLLAADPGVDAVPVQLPVLYPDLAPTRPVSRLLKGSNPGSNIPAKLPLLYLGLILVSNLSTDLALV